VHLHCFWNANIASELDGCLILDALAWAPHSLGDIFLSVYESYHTNRSFFFLYAVIFFETKPLHFPCSTEFCAAGKITWGRKRMATPSRQTNSHAIYIICKCAGELVPCGVVPLVLGGILARTQHKQMHKQTTLLPAHLHIPTSPHPPTPTQHTRITITEVTNSKLLPSFTFPPHFPHFPTWRGIRLWLEADILQSWEYLWHTHSQRLASLITTTAGNHDLSDNLSHTNSHAHCELGDQTLVKSDETFGTTWVIH